MKIRIPAVVLLITTLIIMSCTSQTTTDPTPTTETQATEIEINSVSASGEVVPAVWRHLSFINGGNNISLIVETGAIVQEGDLLASVNADTAQATVDAALAQLANAEANLSKLIDSDAPDADIAAARAAVVAAESALVDAKRIKEDTSLLAPFGGTVVDTFFQNGDSVAPGAPVLLLADLNTLQVHTSDLSELEVVHVDEGNTADIWFDALPDEIVTGNVTQIALQKSPGSGVYYRVVIQLDTIPEKLRWGMGAFIVISVEDEE